MLPKLINTVQKFSEVTAKILEREADTDGRK